MHQNPEVPTGVGGQELLCWAVVEFSPQKTGIQESAFTTQDKAGDIVPNGFESVIFGPNDFGWPFVRTHPILVHDNSR